MTVSKMRDHRASFEYFDDVITRNLKGLKEGQENAADPAIRADADLYATLTHLYRECSFTLVDATYSAGEPRQAVLQRVPELVKAETIYRRSLPSTQHGPFTFEQHPAQYTGPLRILSLAVLADAPQPTVTHLVDATGCRGMDSVYDLLADPDHLTGSTATPTVVWPKPYKRLADVMTAGPEKRPALMASFLKYWYTQNRRAPWWGSHLTVGTRNFSYTGYWCYEAAAVTKALKIDDSLYRANEYYPRDLLPEKGLRSWQT